MKLRISAKMLAGFLTMSALLLAGTVVTILYTYRLHRVTSESVAHNLLNLKNAQRLQITLFQMRGYTSNYLVDGNPAWLKTLAQERKEFQLLLREARNLSNTAEELQALEQLVRQFGHYGEELEKAWTAIQTGKPQTAHDLLWRANRAEYEAMYEQCAALIMVKENGMNTARAEIDRTNAIVRWTMYGLCLGGVALGGLLGWTISRSIVKPIYELVLKMRDAAGSEWVERFDVSGGAELEALDQHVHELIERVHTTTADLEKKQRLLARAEKLAALGRVAAGVAHEIRNPLTSIKMLIYTLQQELTSTEEQHNDLQVIFKEIERMERFVRDFLEFARPPDPKPGHFDLQATIQDTLTLLAPRLRQQHIRVFQDHAPRAQHLYADADQIKQVLMNLMLNALEFMPAGGQLRLTTRVQEGKEPETSKRWAQILLCDTGSGIPPELLENLFDPFVSGREEGVGLGLSIAHQIVHRHGGWIEALNNAEGGATFVITLPAGELGEYARAS